MEKLSGTKILCVYGEEAAETLCKDLDPQRATIIPLKGGHHFDGNYQAMAARIVREVNSIAHGSENQ